MSKLVVALAALGAAAAQSLGGAHGGNIADFVIPASDYDAEHDPNNWNADDYCSQSACESDSCHRTWIYLGNGSVQEVMVRADKYDGQVCTHDQAVVYISGFEMIENDMINDDLGQMMLQLENQLFLRSGNEDGDEESEAALGEVRRFKNLKAMTMTLQPVNVTVFGRYCYYGCWCLPNGMHNLASGYGYPVDSIDEVCREFALCYKCLDLDFAGQCKPEVRVYRWGRILDVGGIPYDIKCKDDHNVGPTHRCKRYTCECDRVLAVGLSHVHWVWNESHHARWGGFDRDLNCNPTCAGCEPQDDCCGAYGSASTPNPDPLTRRPYASTNPVTGCCQDVYFYDIASHECCLDTGTVSVEKIGDCLGSVLAPDEIDDFNHLFPGYTKK